jgi:glycine cleavage system H protein
MVIEDNNSLPPRFVFIRSTKVRQEESENIMSSPEAYNVPEGYFYTKDHEWLKSENGKYLVGITDYAAKMLNDIVYVTLPKEGDSLKQKEIFGQVESVKTVSDMYMPVSGTVLRTNIKLAQSPELVTNSPYNEGWLLEINANDFSKESQGLLNTGAYRDFISSLSDST